MLEWDIYLLLKVNNLQLSDIAETLLVFSRNKTIWLPFYLFLILFFLWNYRIVSASYKILLFLSGVGLVDFIGNNAFKKVFQRIRPCKEEFLEGLLEVRVPCSSGFSFISNHAANHMAIAILAIAFIPGMKPIYKGLLIIWAFVIGFAQIFVGVHYPSDVFVGFLVGGSIAFVYSKAVNSTILKRINP
jgi:undecaprenyl-diphosphatase